MLCETFWKRVEQRFGTLQKAFRFFDTSQDNNVDFAEFSKAVSTMGIHLSQHEQEMLFNKLDYNGEGFFTYEKFVRLNGDKRSGVIYVYPPGKRQVASGAEDKGIPANVSKDKGFILDTTGQQITDTFIRRRG